MRRKDGQTKVQFSTSWSKSQTTTNFLFFNIQDWEQFGKEVSTLEGRLLRLEASIATQLNEAKSFGQL